MLTKIFNRLIGLIIVSIVFGLILKVNLCFGFTASKLISVTHSQKNEIESIKLLLKSDTNYTSFNLQNPDRFVIDLEGCYFPNIRETIEVDSNYIKKIRISQFRHDRVRLVIDQKTITPISVQKEKIFNGTLLCMSIQLPKHPVVEEKITPRVIFESFQEQKVQKSKELVDAAMEIEAVNEIPDDLDSLFNVAEDASNTMPDIIPGEKMMDDQIGSIDVASVFSIDGNLKNETAYRMKEPHQFSKIKTILNLKTSGELSDNLSFAIGSRLSYDAVFDLTDDYNDNVENDQSMMVDLRDAYFDLGLGNFDFRLGNQQIVWGQAVGLFFADIVNPKNLREYILPDLDQIRIPVFASNLEYSYESMYFQMIFIPFPEFNEFGKYGSEFDFSKPFYSQNADIILNDPSEPSNSLDNSEIGFRISKLTNGWDMSFFYLYDYNNFPVNYRSISLNPPGSQNPVTITYLPEYERTNRIGATFSKEVMDAILKGEFVYSDTMFFQSSDVTDIDGMEKGDAFDWLMGVDYMFFNSLETNFQLMQRIIFDYDSTMMERKNSTSFSIWLKTGFFENMIEPELLFISSLNKLDYLFRPKITYNHNQRLQFIFGADIFYGEFDGTFGIFDENDRVYLEILYNF